MVCESILEGIGLQKRCSVLAVSATFFGVCVTWVVGGILRLGILGYLTGELVSSIAGLAISLFWVKKETGLQFRWQNWVGIPLLASALCIFTCLPCCIHCACAFWALTTLLI